MAPWRSSRSTSTRSPSPGFASLPWPLVTPPLRPRCVAGPPHAPARPRTRRPARRWWNAPRLRGGILWPALGRPPARGARASAAHRHAGPDDSGHGLRTGAPALRLPAAGLQRGEASAAPHVQRAHALRPVELVRVDREEIDRDLPDVNAKRADGLDGVAVERH